MFPLFNSRKKIQLECIKQKIIVQRAFVANQISDFAKL